MVGRVLKKPLSAALVALVVLAGVSGGVRLVSTVSTQSQSPRLIQLVQRSGRILRDLPDRGRLHLPWNPGVGVKDDLTGSE